MQIDMLKLIIITITFLIIMLLVMYSIVVPEEERRGLPTVEQFKKTMKEHYWDGNKKYLPIGLIIFYIFAIILICNLKGIKL